MKAETFGLVLKQRDKMPKHSDVKYSNRLERDVREPAFVAGLVLFMCVILKPMT